MAHNRRVDPLLKNNSRFFPVHAENGFKIGALKLKKLKTI
jgi:hypothetical protein